MSARVRNLSGQVRHHGIDLLLFPTDSHRVLAWAARPTHVRFGSKADMCGAKEHVHLTPNSTARADSRKRSCPLCAQEVTGCSMAAKIITCPLSSPLCN